MNPTRILIVEHEAIATRTLCPQLAELGYESISQVATGEEAVVLAEQMRSDLVLMDIHLPGETRLYHKPEEMAAILRTAVDGFWMVDMRGRFLEVNDACCRMHGYTREEMLRLSIADLEADETPNEIAASIERIKQTGYDRFERRHRCQDGRFIDVEVSINYLPIASGRFFCFLRDITERKRAEAEKTELEAQYRQHRKTESLGRMAEAIAHHFNNQLQAVMGNLDLAMSVLPRNNEAITLLTGAMRAAHKAAEVSGWMQTYLGHTGGRREPLDLAETCRLSLTMLHASLPRSMVIEVDFPSPGPIVSAKAPQIQQVLTNLVTNAWEATGSGRGVIRLTVKTILPQDVPTVHRFPAGWQPRANIYACLMVTDTGCGIANQDFEELFDPFFSHKLIGRGIGLSVVLGFVRAHDGCVTVASELGRGSTFKVFLPVSGQAGA